MHWNFSDTMVIVGMVLLASLIVTLAEINHRWQRKGYMFSKDGHAWCKCTHRGYEHSFRHGNCRYETVVGGWLFKCPCKGFSES